MTISRYGLSIVTPNTWEPLTVTEVKNYLRVDDTQDDSLIQQYIGAARRLCETITDRAIVQQTYLAAFDSFYGYEVFGGQLLLGQRPVPQWRSGGIAWLYGRTLPLPLPPLQAVNSIVYFDPTGTQQTLATSLYVVDTINEPARIAPSYGNVWPVTWEMPNAVQITFTAGYASQAAVPETLKLAMYQLMANWYENREAVQVAERMTVTELPWGVVNLLGVEDTGNYV